MKIMAEAKCPNTAYAESLTKKELMKELEMLGVDVTLRPRKSTLVALYLEKLDEPITVTPQEWDEFTAVTHKWTWREKTVAAIIAIGVIQVIAIGAALVIQWVN